MNWLRTLDEGDASQRDLLGGKGANLSEMTRLGLPVPPAFTITTDTFRARNESGDPPGDLWNEVEGAIARLEREIGREFGSSHNPLLVSVRSGAATSMPGMMETILNIGLTRDAVDGLASQTDERFAWDTRRRLLQMYGSIVLGVPAQEFEAILVDERTHAGIEHDHELDASRLQAVAERFEQLISTHGDSMPDDPVGQLRGAILAVFDSWDTPQAAAFRKANAIPDDLGTAVTVQAMVFGNMGTDSASGVAFTRNPSTGAPGIFGEYMVNAQGEDVVAGVRTPEPIESMAENDSFSGAWSDLQNVAHTLESHFHDMQDLEFTVEQGKLWMLQTRTGKRTAEAAVRVAVDQADEQLIDRDTAIERIDPDQIEQLLHPQIDDSQNLEVVATGLPASPGAATGTAVLDTDVAIERAERGEQVILVREETAAEDFPAMQHAAGVLTARGGMTSHAAVVARGMGLPAVTGCSEIDIDESEGLFRVGDVSIRDGDTITIDGGSGRVFLGEASMRLPGLTMHAEKLLSWADSERTLGVRANADTPEDARRSRQLGAEGIGLCRTEHMFFGEERIAIMRQMILARTEADRAKALEHLQRFQTADFVGIFKAMDGLPVTIRLLDPPLHEFLPTTDEEQEELARNIGIDSVTLRDRVESLSEVNPMLGTRGVRVGMIAPEIVDMQARAIFCAATVAIDDGIDVRPEIMIPLVSLPGELERQRTQIESIADEVAEKTDTVISYKIGTMIETPRAALLAGELAKHADFFSLGTNDLTQMTYGISRDDSGRFLPDYIEEGIAPNDPFQVLDRDGVGRLVEQAVSDGLAANPNLSIGVCGEHGGDPDSIEFCHRLGIDYVSCSPMRVPVARLAAAQAALKDAPKLAVAA